MKQTSLNGIQLESPYLTPNQSVLRHEVCEDARRGQRLRLR